MHVRRKKSSWLQTAADRVTDPDWRADIIDQASEKATHLASDVAQRSTDLGAQVSEKVSEVAHNVSDEAHARLAQMGSPPKKKHRLRKLVMLTGAGAVAAYFLDPQNGRERRANARRRTSTSAAHLGNGLDRAAHVAREAADVAATDSKPDAMPAQSARTDQSVQRDTTAPIS